MSLEEGEDGGLLVVKCVLKCLVHKKDETPPQPWFPSEQGVKMSDGTFIPLGSGTQFFTRPNDVAVTLQMLGY